MKRLSRCSSKPNCVCSLYKDDESHFIEPLQVSSNPINKVVKVLRDIGLDIKTLEDDYIHAIATTKIMRFKDDVEVQYFAKDKMLHFKSSSRVGYSDLGANKKRIESIVRQLRATQ